MRPTISSPLPIRGVAFGGPQPLFCIPLVAVDFESLGEEARIACDLMPDLVEWRADFFRGQTADRLVEAAGLVRSLVSDTPVICTLRAMNEGGAQDLAQSTRRALIEALVRSGTIDIVDLELANEPDFLAELMAAARECGIRVLLAVHDFGATPSSDVLLGHIRAMHALGADIAKISVMPNGEDDVLRLLQVTIEARREFPSLPLVTMSMGPLGSLTRVAGFLYGSDMAFAVGKEASAPGQMPIEDARTLTELLLRYS